MKKLLFTGAFGVFLLGGVFGQDTDPDFRDLDPVGVLISHASRGETWLLVQWFSSPRLDENVVIEDRDHGWRDVREVKEVHPGDLILADQLKRAYYPGSRIYQNKSR